MQERFIEFITRDRNMVEDKYKFNFHSGFSQQEKILYLNPMLLN